MDIGMPLEPGEKSPWHGRLEAMAKAIPSGSHVLDIGAGGQGLRSLLPEGCSYTPLDKECANGISLDLEVALEIPAKADIAVMSGVLEHVYRPIHALRLAIDVAPKLVLSYATLAKGQHPSAGRDGWRTHLSVGELTLVLEALGYRNVEKIAEWKAQEIFCAYRYPHPAAVV